MIKCYEFTFRISMGLGLFNRMVAVLFDQTAARARRRVAKHVKTCGGELTNFQRIVIDDEEINVVGRPLL
jgi:hypothetical protein